MNQSVPQDHPKRNVTSDINCLSSNFFQQPPTERSRCIGVYSLSKSSNLLIFRQVRGKNGKNSGTLVNLACTCRAFSTSAPDVLWEHLDSFVRLIQCLPRDLFKPQHEARWPDGVAGSKLTLERAISVKDWKIFFKYSSRLRSVASGRSYRSLNDQGCTRYTNDVIFAFCHPSTGGPLIPRLKELSWDIPGQVYASLLHHLLTPSLVSLTIHDINTLANPLRAPEVSVLSYIAIACPLLKVLKIESPLWSCNSLNSEGSRILSTAILSLNSLRKLPGVTLDEQTILHVSRLQLTELSMSLPAGLSVDNIRPHLTAPAFGSVDALTVHANTFPALTLLLEALEITPKSVTLRVETASVVEQIKPLFTALVNACSSEELLKICLDTPNLHYDQPFQWSHAFNLDMLEPLFSLPHTSSFTLDVPHKIMLDDADITTIAKHWPNLRTLSINEMNSWNGYDPSPTTHRSLLALAAHCPELAEIAMSIDFSEIDVESPELLHSRPNGGVTNRNLSAAFFMAIKIDHSGAIAGFLSDAFPRLFRVMARWRMNAFAFDDEEDESSDMYEMRWSEVEDLLSTVG
ncbi:hypothetical protein HYDPIDRAFT_34787 [Hydnomerulius pinastri MD-312]|uniref:F-box domain-containing protein n=1 Tax=Hydnomerulius pinastri MD-312 TaxID=994086 RepID=A0A0C9W6J5_9AGAM|nr:hypothetical protein HYDPIDRAFT_34787 [Hydnomerulius pinastri MD-312]